MKKKIVSYNDKKTNPGKGATGRSEKDIDDLVHSDKNETATEQTEEDLDDKVHRVKKSESSQINQPVINNEDPDYLVHGNQEEDEE